MMMSPEFARNIRMQPEAKVYAPANPEQRVLLQLPGGEAAQWFDTVTDALDVAIRRGCRPIVRLL